MHRGDLNDLPAFLAVARERSFTRAAARLGVSQSALSHTIRGLEERLGVRLLTRTTRSVSPTEAGERLLHTVGPRLEEIEAVSEFRDKPAGTIRITAGDHAIETALWPKLTKFIKREGSKFGCREGAREQVHEKQVTPMPRRRPRAAGRRA
jgi:DNA-binding transcriptional LysR family regulator